MRVIIDVIEANTNRVIGQLDRTIDWDTDLDKLVRAWRLENGHDFGSYTYEWDRVDNIFWPEDL